MAKVGRKRKETELMLRIDCLQQGYNLSDPALAAEEGIKDRLSFQRFLRLDPFVDAVPDETTILNFRHLLEKNDLQEMIFKAINQHLEDKGLLMKRGTLVDATIIAAPSSTKNQSSKDSCQVFLARPTDNCSQSSTRLSCRYASNRRTK